jgi:hypothetical protein
MSSSFLLSNSLGYCSGVVEYLLTRTDKPLHYCCSHPSTLIETFKHNNISKNKSNQETNDSDFELTVRNERDRLKAIHVRTTTSTTNSTEPESASIQLQHNDTSLIPHQTVIVESFFELLPSPHMCGQWMQKGYSMRLAKPATMQDLLDLPTPLPKELLHIVAEYCDGITKSAEPHTCHSTSVLCDWLSPCIVQPHQLWIDYMNHVIAAKSAQLQRISEYTSHHEVRQLIQPREGSNIDAIQFPASNIHHSSNANRIVITKCVVAAHREWLNPSIKNYSYAPRAPFQPPVVEGYFVEFSHLQLNLPMAHRKSIRDLCQGQGPEGNQLLNDCRNSVCPESLARQCDEQQMLLASQLLFTAPWIVSDHNFNRSSRSSSTSIASDFIGLPIHKSLFGFSFSLCSQIQFGLTFFLSNAIPAPTIILHKSD